MNEQQIVRNRILFEDNHLIIINKLPGEIVQADKTGDICLLDLVKQYLKERYGKPGNVFLGLPHRLDRPTSGVVVLCKTSKSLERMNRLFKEGKVNKTYYAITDKPMPKPSDRLEHYIVRNTKLNKSFAYKDIKKDSQKAVLEYKAISASDKYYLSEIRLLTGRHHQIRAQLSALGVHIKGDLKYGAARSNPDGGISLHAGRIVFMHPVSGKEVSCIAPFPSTDIWNVFIV